MTDSTLIGGNPNTVIQFTRQSSGDLLLTRTTQSAFTTDRAELRVKPSGRIFLDTVQLESRGEIGRSEYKPDLYPYFNDLHRRLRDRDEGLGLDGRLERTSFLQLQRILDEFDYRMPPLEKNSAYRQARFRG